MIRKKIYLSPPVLFLGVWFFVISLYQMGLSRLLSKPITILNDLFIIFGSGFCVGALLALLFRPKFRFDFASDYRPFFLRNLGYLFWFLVSFSILEVVYEGYVPVLAMAFGQALSHFDFGIPSIHGLVIAGFSVFGTVSFGVFLTTGKRKALYYAMVPVAYSFIIVNRKMMTICFLQYLLVFLHVRGINVREILKATAVVLLFVFVFGLVGTIRGHTTTIEKYGKFIPEFAFPGDEGFKWIYLYITTPINNFAHTTIMHGSEGNSLPIRTFGSLVPSAIRNYLVGPNTMSRFKAASVDRYWLRSPVFNVSTGFNAPYLDGGFLGVFIYSAFIGFLCTFVYLGFGNMLGLATFSVLMSGALITVFSNNFGNLNYVGQFLFLLMLKFPIFFKRLKRPNFNG